MFLSVEDYYTRHIPEYYDTMWMDGYTPTEIMHALHKTMRREQEERKKIDRIHITSEVKIKR